LRRFDFAIGRTQRNNHRLQVHERGEVPILRGDYFVLLQMDLEFGDDFLMTINPSQTTYEQHQETTPF
jgi:hypothetical protein